MDIVIVGKRGQITIPSKYRKKLNIKPKQQLLITEVDGNLLIIPAKPISSENVKLREFSDEEIEMFLEAEKISEEEIKEIEKNNNLQ